MKYTYAYRTSDGTRHEAAMDAESREAVFAALRERGIRAIKVVAADGSKANGEVRGVRKRVLAAAVALTALVAVVGTAIVVGHGLRPRRDGAADLTQSLNDMTRRQVIGDAAVIEKGILTGWADVFALEGERFLASFAIPGVKAGQRSTTVEEIEKALAQSWREVSDTSRQFSPGDGLEARQIRAMVEGMKREARAYVAAGGSIVEYGKRLTERQDAEIAIYERARAEIEDAKKRLSGAELVAFWEQRNDQLRNLGIKLISLED